MSSDDVYRRVGRGGAGNFYSKKDIEEAAKAHGASSDLEAQNEPATASSLREAAAQSLAHTQASSSSFSGGPPQYSRAGRGGAGNFYEGTSSAGGASTIGDSIEREAEARRAQALVSTTLAMPRPGGLSGRGGMGNWTTTGSSPAPPQGEERARMEQVEARILKDVDAGLAPPPKTYHQSERNVDE